MTPADDRLWHEDFNANESATKLAVFRFLFWGLGTWVAFSVAWVALGGSWWAVFAFWGAWAVIVLAMAGYGWYASEALLRRHEKGCSRITNLRRYAEPEPERGV